MSSHPNETLSSRRICVYIQDFHIGNRMLHVYGVPYYARDPQNLEEAWYTRDQDAQGQLVEALHGLDREVEFVWNIHNHLMAPQDARAHNLDAWSTNEMGICCTRLPLSDPQHNEPGGHRVNVKRRNTRIEQTLFESACGVWAWLDREKSILHPHIIAALPEECKPWCELHFKQHRDSRITSWSRGPLVQERPTPFSETPACAAGFLYYTPRLSKDAQCAFLSCFSQAGYETLTFLHLIRWQYGTVLEDILRAKRPRLIVACFQIPDKKNTDTAQIKDTPCEIVLNAEYRKDSWQSVDPLDGYGYTSPEGLQAMWASPE